MSAIPKLVVDPANFNVRIENAHELSPHLLSFNQFTSRFNQFTSRFNNDPFGDVTYTYMLYVEGMLDTMNFSEKDAILDCILDLLRINMDLRLVRRIINAGRSLGYHYQEFREIEKILGQTR